MPFLQTITREYAGRKGFTFLIHREDGWVFPIPTEGDEIYNIVTLMVPEMATEQEQVRATFVGTDDEFEEADSSTHGLKYSFWVLIGDHVAEHLVSLYHSRINREETTLPVTVGFNLNVAR